MSPTIRRLAGSLAVLAAIAFAMLPSAGQAHDASSWGGLFRTRDGGLTWFQASAGKVMGGALAVAIDPADPTRLLLGTDSGLLSSHNGGRDWDLIASDVLLGPVLAVAFDSVGQQILAASAAGLWRSEDGVLWRSTLAPVGTSPARGVTAGSTPGAFYLLGWSGLFRTDDSGATWSERDVGLPGPNVTRLLVSHDVPEKLFALSAGQVWSSLDAGRSWQPRQSGLPAGQIQTLAPDPRISTGVWAGGANQLFHSEDAGLTWQRSGRPLEDADTEIRGIVVDGPGNGRRIVLSTHRGLYATRDGGDTWDLLVNNLPGHIESGPLVRDESQPSTVYAGFSVTPYDEYWRNAAGRSALARLARSELAGATAFLILVGLGSGLALRWLARW